MQSAEEFVNCLYYTSDPLIRARDREIVERCKDHIHAAVPWNEYPAVDYVLDCILRDLG